MPLTTAAQDLITGTLTWLTTGRLFHPQTPLVTPSRKRKRCTPSVKKSSRSTTIEDKNASNARKRPVSTPRAPSARISNIEIRVKRKASFQGPKGSSSEHRLAVRTCVACFQQKTKRGFHSLDKGDHHAQNRSWGPFPPASAFPGCNHPLSVCMPCFRQHIEAQMEAVGPENLSCPQCPNLLQHHQIRRLVSKQVFERYDTASTQVQDYDTDSRRFDILTLRRTLGREPNFVGVFARGAVLAKSISIRPIR